MLSNRLSSKLRLWHNSRLPLISTPGLVHAEHQTQANSAQNALNQSQHLQVSGLAHAEQQTQASSAQNVLSQSQTLTAGHVLAEL
jgi:hypothetical protein